MNSDQNTSLVIMNISGEEIETENGFTSSMLTFAAVMTFIIMFVGIFGNFLTIVALLRCPKVRNVAAAFIISLCLADLIFCALVLPFSALRFLQGTWTHGDFLCKLIPFIQYGNIGVSLLCIAMITINRYVMIAHHTSYARVYQRHWIALMIAFCWLFSYGMQLPTLFGVWGTFDYDPKLATCSIMSDAHGRSSKTSLFVTAFVIPCLIIIACYTKIFWVVHKSEQRLKKHANKQNSIPNNLRSTTTTTTNATAIKPTTVITDNGQSRVSSNLPSSDSSYSTEIKQHETVQQKPSRIKDQREVRAKRNEWRITKMVLAIFLSFVICYLPITIAKVADKDVEHPGFHILSYIMLYLSACINPIIYVIMNKQYRKAYKTVIMCEPSRLLPFGKTNAVGNSVAEKWKDTGLSNNHSRTLVSQMSGPEQQNTSLSSSQMQPITLEMTTRSSIEKGDKKLMSMQQLQYQQPKMVPINTTTIMKPLTITTLPLTMTMPPPPPPPPPTPTPPTSPITPTIPTTPTTSQMQQIPIRTSQLPAQTIMTNTPISMKEQSKNGISTIQLNLRKSISVNNNNNNNSNNNSNNNNNMIMGLKKESNRITLVGDDIILEEEEESLNLEQMEIPAITQQLQQQQQIHDSTTPIQTTEKVYVNVPIPKKIQYYGQNINVIPDNSNLKLQAKEKI